MLSLRIENDRRGAASPAKSRIWSSCNQCCCSHTCENMMATVFLM